GCGLAGDGYVIADADGGLQGDVTADVEDDDASGVAHGIAERADAAVGESGHVVNRATASAGRAGTETIRAWKRGDVGRDGADDKIHLPGRAGVDLVELAGRQGAERDGARQQIAAIGEQ